MRPSPKSLHLHSDGNGGLSRVCRMEARVAKLEGAMEYVQRDIAEIKSELKEMRQQSRLDFRLHFSALAALAIGLATLMAKGFAWI